MAHPFLVALPLGIIGLYLRLKLDETLAFQEQGADREHSPLRELFTGHWRDMLTCFGFILLNIAVYTTASVASVRRDAITSSATLYASISGRSSWA